MPLHPATEQVLRFFDAEHLREGPIKEMSEDFVDFSEALRSHCETQGIDSPEVTVGFRKLLEAKDCFVRAAAAHEQDKKNLVT